jgi:hypothetical protein
VPAPGTAEMVKTADHLEVLETGQVLVDGRVLTGEADVLAHPGGIANDVEAGHTRGALVRHEQRRQDPNSGCLAGSVGTQQPEDHSRLDPKVDAAQGLDTPKLFRRS